MDLISLLTSTKDETLTYFDLPPIELAKAYAPGKWNVRKLLIHLADAESVLQESIKRIIAEPGKVIWAFDQDLWCQALAYETFPLELSKALYLANRQSMLYLVSKYYIAVGERTFVHSQTGLRTLKEEFEKVALHNQAHLHQIRRALEIPPAENISYVR